MKDTDGLFEGDFVGVRAGARHWGLVIHGAGADSHWLLMIDGDRRSELSQRVDVTLC